MSFYFAFKPAGINRALGTKLRSPYHVGKKILFTPICRGKLRKKM